MKVPPAVIPVPNIRRRQLSVEAKKAGVITYSSGNHGQAITLAGKFESNKLKKQ